MSIPDPDANLWRLAYGPQGQIVVQEVHPDHAHGEPPSRSRTPDPDPANDPEFERARVAGLAGQW